MAEEISRRQVWSHLLAALRPTEASPRRRRARPASPPPKLPPIPIRPPGSLTEAAFRYVCLHCGACREACEPGALVELGEAYGDAQGTPGFFPASSPCLLCPDLPCIEACSSGALKPLAAARDARMGTAVIDLERCYDSRGTPCDECALQCPTGIKAIRMGTEGPQVAADLCTGCGICVQACPAEPAAIRIRPVALGGLNPEPMSAPPGDG